MLILDSPKSDILFATGNQFIRFDRAELDSENIEIADLLGYQLRLSLSLNTADIKKQDSLSFVLIKTHHHQMFLVR